MKGTEIMKTASRSFHRAGLILKKHSPEIFIVAGVVGTVTSAVMACKATTKLNTILDKSKEDIDAIHTAIENKAVNGEEYTAEDGKKDLTIVYTQTGLKLVKLYTPSVALGALSLTAIIASHRMLTKRNAALAAAYTAVDKGFKQYRGRVVERFGKDIDRELRYNIKAKEIEERVVDENGNESITKTTVKTIDPLGHDEYSRIFDELNPYWTKSSEYNMTFLMNQQRTANKLFEEQGYLFLNDVYKMLGFLPTQAGQVIGWIYDPKDPNLSNYIDFGIHDLYNKDKCSFVNGHEKSIILDFNVDGDVLRLMP